MIRFAALFPGQGSQHPGMGRSLASAFPVSRETLERADAALGVPLSATCFEGTDAQLARTETTQPAILAVSIAALRALEERGARPSASAGHSLGEWSANVAAGTIAFEDAVRAVRRRGAFMQEAVPAGEGAMAAILGLDAPAIGAICARVAGDEVVSPANFNGAGQIVIAGHAAAVQRACEAALAAGARRAVPLPVSAPFHCALMRPAAERLNDVVGAMAWSDPSHPVYTNVDAAPVTTAAQARQALLAQVASPVRWQEEIERMAADGHRVFVEVGPGKVLSGLVRRIVKEAVVLNVSDPETLEQSVRTLEEAA
ncbi:MAG TPA: ACP S-malonyltransferase [Candidatus Polarisedimenticolaceae bacterium]